MHLNKAYPNRNGKQNVTVLNVTTPQKTTKSNALSERKHGDDSSPHDHQGVVYIGNCYKAKAGVDRTDTYTKGSPTPGPVQQVTDNDTGDTNRSSTVTMLTSCQKQQRQRFRESLKKRTKEVEADPTSGEMDAKWMETVEEKFTRITGGKGHFHVAEFKEALSLKQFFAERFFELFDQDASGFIDLLELMEGLRMLAKGTPAQKLQFLFDVFDIDGSGFIERDELKAVLQACMEESSLSLPEGSVDELTDVLFDAADADGNDMISFEEMELELEKHPGVVENLTISAAKWLQSPTDVESQGPNLRYFTRNYWVNNRSKGVFFLVYWLINVFLFAMAAGYQYRDCNNWIKIARGCGLCLNFNCTFIVILMLRKCITFIRMTKLCHMLPLDHHLMSHKHVGMAIISFSIVHTLAHIGNAETVSRDTHLEIWEILFTTKARDGFVYGSSAITGWLLNIVLIVMVVFSAPFVRKSGHFQLFYWSHMLYVPFWILVILHAPHFWKWFLVPGLMFFMEKLFRSKLMKLARYGDTYIDEVNLLPSKVTHLIITRPLNFRYQPGDYVFVQIPAIAQQEWHPFTISSAPEMEGHIWLHVRSAGNWTNKLYEYFDRLKVDQSTDSTVRTSSTKKVSGFEWAYSRPSASTKSRQKRQTNKLVNVKCYIDGPYGTGTREVFNTDHAVLVGAGIGVTPMASILQSVWYRFNAARHTCPRCEHVWYSEEETEGMRLKKVDFIWVNRDQKSFEWFITLLNQLEIEQSSHHGALENSIQIHLYMTAAQKKTDMKGIGLQMALDLMYEKTEKDLITGLRTKTEPGRPDFDKLFKNIGAEQNGKVKVFICGPPAVTRTVKDAAARHKLECSQENF